MQLSFKTLITKAGSDKISIRKLKAEYFNNQSKIEESKAEQENISDRELRIKIVLENIKRQYPGNEVFCDYKMEKHLNLIYHCLYHDKY